MLSIRTDGAEVPMRTAHLEGISIRVVPLAGLNPLAPPIRCHVFNGSFCFPSKSLGPIRRFLARLPAHDLMTLCLPARGNAFVHCAPGPDVWLYPVSDSWLKTAAAPAGGGGGGGG